MGFNAGSFWKRIIMTFNPQPKTKIIRLTGKAYKQLQKAVLERDNFTCRKCGCYTNAPPHHRIKLSQGGSDILDNLETLCLDCHAKEHN